MIVVILDASALVKRYSPEDGSQLVNALFSHVPIRQITCATLGILEVVSILVQKRNDGRLSPEAFAQAAVEINLEIVENDLFAATSLNDDLILAAIEFVQKHNINASDALILRSVLNLQQAMAPERDQLVFWCCDKRLIRAAKVEGVTVFDPEAETIERFNDLYTG